MALLLMISLQRAEAKIPSFEAYNVLLRQGPNSTHGYNTVRCGGSEERSVPPGAAQFGDIFCFDMPLYKEKDPNSELLGRVQGRYSFSQLTGGNVFVTETFIFNGTSVPYKGSFSALGIEMIGKVSSKPITGGTDDYELVTGNAITTPIPGLLLDAFGNTQFWFNYQLLFS
ncbi:hypothetical protein GOP47_0000967 [Adiantum capillus-veneris]|uniref:Dirigent protein n=1 Tax=Adiantum capillus-veneris TaxID=13818 RepID=A0A9D4VFY7_ADICA|nr:hypothetical protein GOP47_0000967 [Adiantum capillus-veneris]